MSILGLSKSHYVTTGVAVIRFNSYTSFLTRTRAFQSWIVQPMGRHTPQSNLLTSLAMLLFTITPRTIQPLASMIAFMTLPTRLKTWPIIEESQWLSAPHLTRTEKQWRKHTQKQKIQQRLGDVGPSFNYYNITKWIMYKKINIIQSSL